MLVRTKGWAHYLWISNFKTQLTKSSGPNALRVMHAKHYIIETKKGWRVHRWRKEGTGAQLASKMGADWMLRFQPSQAPSDDVRVIPRCKLQCSFADLSLGKRSGRIEKLCSCTVGLRPSLSGLSEAVSFRFSKMIDGSHGNLESRSFTFFYLNFRNKYLGKLHSITGCCSSEQVAIH